MFLVQVPPGKRLAALALLLLCGVYRGVAGPPSGLLSAVSSGSQAPSQPFLEDEIALTEEDVPRGGGGATNRMGLAS